MKKHLFNKGLLAAVAIFATLTCQSCQRKAPPSPPQPKDSSSQPLPSSQFNCDESEEGCNVEEAGEEAMIHVIEIDQPETTNVTEENSSTVPAVEAVVEVSAVPAEAPVEAAPVAETVSAPQASDAAGAVAVQGADAPSAEPKKEQDQ